MDGIVAMKKRGEEGGGGKLGGGLVRWGVVRLRLRVINTWIGGRGRGRGKGRHGHGPGFGGGGGGGVNVGV